MWIASLIGRWAWPVISWTVPAAGPRVTMALICIAILAVSHGGVALAVHMHGYRARVDAVASARAAFVNALADERRRHEQEIDAARAAAEAVTPTPDDRAMRVRLCKQSPTCRERG